MTRATHWDRGWNGAKTSAPACGSNAAPHGSNVSRNTTDVTCRRCRKIIDWQAPVKPVERRATVAESEPVIGYRHNPCRSCGAQTATTGGLFCLDCICAKMDAAGLTVRDIVPAMKDFEAATKTAGDSTQDEDPPCTECTAIDRCSHPEERRDDCPPVGYVAPFGEDPEARFARLERLLGELKKLIHFSSDEFARIATDTNDNGGTDWWFECHKCSEIIEGTEDLTDEKANGNVFKCSCGQEFIGSTHIMLHAISAARDLLAKGGAK